MVPFLHKGNGRSLGQCQIPHVLFYKLKNDACIDRAAVASKETEEMKAKMLQEDLMVKMELLELLAQPDLKEMSDE